VIVLDESADDLGRTNKWGWVQVFLAVKPLKTLVVDQQDAIQDAVFPHEVFGRRNIIRRLRSSFDGRSGVSRLDASGEPSNYKSGSRDSSRLEKLPP